MTKNGILSPYLKTNTVYTVYVYIDTYIHIYEYMYYHKYMYILMHTTLYLYLYDFFLSISIYSFFHSI